jgi:hypothetical protein
MLTAFSLGIEAGLEKSAFNVGSIPGIPTVQEKIRLISQSKPARKAILAVKREYRRAKRDQKLHEAFLDQAVN